MAQIHRYRDIDGTLTVMSGYAPRLQWTAQSRAEEGMYGSWTVVLDDPTGELDILGHRQWFVEDDESEDEDDIIFGGFTGAQTFSKVAEGRRTLPDGPARYVTVELMDANTWFSKIIMRGADADRPVETDAERMDWLLGTSEAAQIIDTTTFVNASGPKNMDAADLRGTYVGQIIADCASASGKNHYLWYRKVSGIRTLTIWYGRSSLTTYTSPFFITNDRADFDQDAIEDGTAVVWPLSLDAQMKRSPEKQYCGCYATYGEKGAATYRHNADTHALIASYGSGHRDMVSHFSLVKTKTAAQARADRQLLDVQDQELRVTTVLRNIPSTRVTLAKAGMRLPVKGTHWGPTLDDWMFLRIVSAEPRPHSKGDLYDIALELVGPGPASDGPPAPPFEGTVFAGLQFSSVDPDSDPDHNGKGSLMYGHNYDDDPAGGWLTAPTQGPIAIDQSSAPYTSITVSEDMVVRIHARAYTTGFYSGSVTITLNVRVNGVVVGSQSTSGTNTLLIGPLEVDLRNYPLVAGDVVSVDGTGGDPDAAWTNVGTNLSFLKVGRGEVYDGFDLVFEGP